MLLFVLGYFLGGFSALMILGLSIAARNGDRARIHEQPSGREGIRSYRER